MYQAPFLGNDWVSDPAVKSPMTLDSPEAAFRRLSDSQLWPVDREAAWLLTLDTKHRLRRLSLISVGSLGHTFMSPREIMRLALLDNAAAIVVAHNHPSGDPEPSGDDVAVTRRLSRAGEIVGVELLDHLVLAARQEGGFRFVSLSRRGKL